MRQEDLKNKMDQIDHNFDQELLWTNIQKHKEKKRRNLFFWFFPIGGILIIAVSLFYFSTNETRNEGYDNDSVVVEESLGNQKKEAITIEQNKETNNSSVLLADKTNDDKKEIQSILKEENKELNQVKTQSQNLVNSNNSIEVDRNVLNNEKVNATASPVNDLTHQATEDSQNVINNSVRKKVIVETNVEANILNLEIEEILEDERSFIQVAELELLPSKQLDFQRDKWLLHSKIQPLKRTKENNIVFGIHAGFGYDFQNIYGGTLADIRNSNEKPLETISIGAFGRKHINRNLFLELDFRWTRGETKLQRSDRNATYFLLDSVDLLLEEWTEKEYTYYNQYYRFDVAVGLGYKFNLSNNWHVAPAISIGYNLVSYQKGDYWDQRFSMTSLENAPEYRPSSSLFYGGQLKVMKELKNNIILGIDLEVQKRNSLTNRDSYSHIITPTSIKLSLAKRF